jgi:hypothetical protein
MKKQPKVRCNRADRCVEGCDHAQWHEPMMGSTGDDNEACTAWADHCGENRDGLSMNARCTRTGK